MKNQTLGNKTLGNKKIRILQLFGLASLAAMAFAGCTTSSDEDVTTDGGNIVLTQEAGNMSVVLNESDGSAKTASDTTVDAVTQEKIIIARHYEPACQCFVRQALFTSSVGFERERTDSIWLDSSGHALTTFRLAHADSVRHIRHVTRINSNLGKEIDLTFNTTLTRNAVQGGVIFQWNGAIIGTFNGTQFNSSNFNITFTFGAGVGFAVAGTIDVQRGNYEVDIVFDSANGTATCTVKHNGVVTRTTHIDANGNES